MIAHFQDGMSSFAEPIVYDRDAVGETPIVIELIVDEGSDLHE